MQRGRNNVLAVQRDGFDVIRDAGDVAADLASDVKDRRGAPVAGDQSPAVGGALLDGGDVAQADRALLVRTDHSVAHFVRALELGIGQHQKLLVVAVETSHATDVVGGAQPLRNVGQAEVVGQSLLGINEDGDLTRIRGVHFHAAHALDAAEHRPQVVDRVIVQVGIGHVAVQNQAQNRENAGRQPLDLNLGLGGERAARFIHTRLHQLQRLLHIGARTEEDGNFRSAADGARTHPPHSQHGTHLFFNRTGNDEQSGVRRKIARVDQNHNAGKGQFRINIAGKLEQRDQARQGERAGEQEYSAAVAAAKADQVHCVMCTFAFSGRP